MSKKNLIVGLGCALLLAGSIAVVAGIGGDDGGASDFDLDRDFPDLGDDCICPLYYDPVVCIKKNPDGTFTRRWFSNACFAGCAGYTQCLGFATVR